MKLGQRRRTSGRRARAGLTGSLVAATLTVVIAGPASAFLFVQSAPGFPEGVSVGQPSPASFGVGDFSTPPESTQFPVLTISQIHLVPSCDNLSSNCAGGVEPGVLTLSATGTGTGPTSCTGTWTITEIRPGVFRFTPPGGEGSLQLATGEACVVDFTVLARRVPSVDVNPAVPGVQTNQLSSVTPSSGAQQFPPSLGSDQTTVDAAQPTITTQATESATLGEPISDFAGVTGVPQGPVMTGTVTFSLYGPGDATCAGAPVFTSTDPLAHVVPSEPPQAVAFSDDFTPTQAGTYRWVATYSGDANYLPATSPCNAPNEISAVTAPVSPISVFRPSNGFWFFSDGPTVHWGTSGDIAVPADYDGDGDGDIAVFRPSNGVWFVLNGPTVLWGQQGDVPVPADYDDDGDDDIAVFRPSHGAWYILGQQGTFWGISGDVPVPADYDGDGDDDIAVFRPSNGVWFVQNGPTAPWGTTGDIPVPADYDFDGDDDIALFRPSVGVWFVLGGPTVQWGTNGDDPPPLPAAIREAYFP